jgi:hypothetical protein
MQDSRYIRPFAKDLSDNKIQATNEPQNPKKSKIQENLSITVTKELSTKADLNKRSIFKNSDFPSSCGVYRIFDSKDKIIYVGECI